MNRTQSHSKPSTKGNPLRSFSNRICGSKDTLPPDLEPWVLLYTRKRQPPSKMLQLTDLRISSFVNASSGDKRTKSGKTSDLKAAWLEMRTSGPFFAEERQILNHFATCWSPGLLQWHSMNTIFGGYDNAGRCSAEVRSHMYQ